MKKADERKPLGSKATKAELREDSKFYRKQFKGSCDAYNSLVATESSAQKAARDFKAMHRKERELVTERDETIRKLVDTIENMAKEVHRLESEVISCRQRVAKSNEQIRAVHDVTDQISQTISEMYTEADCKPQSEVIESANETLSGNVRGWEYKRGDL